MVVVDFHHQMILVGLYLCFHTRFYSLCPSHHALCLEEFGEVDGCGVYLHHLGINPRQQQYVVYELEQHVGVLFYLVDKHGFVAFVVLTLEEFGKTHNGVERCAYLVAHVLEE